MIGNHLSALAVALLSALPATGGGAAAAIWPEGRASETNAFYGFSATFEAKIGESPVLHLAAGSIARVWVNGRFAGYGPARAAEGCMRVDEWPLGPFLRDGRNVLAIEVSNPSVNTLYLPERPAYLFAEVVMNGKPLVVTGRDFKAIDLPRVRRTSRYSYERALAEFYRVAPESYAWRTNGISGAGLRLETRPMLKPLPRGAPYPDFAFDGTFRPTVRTVMIRDPANRPERYCNCDKAGVGTYKGFPKDELEVDLVAAARHLKATCVEPCEANIRGIRLADGEGVVFRSAAVTAGFPKIEVTCEKPTVLWLFTDEFPGEDGLPDPMRFNNCITACGWRLVASGHYVLEGFEPVGLGVAHVVSEGGEVVVGEFDVRTYANPNPARASFRSSDPDLDKVFAAAARSMAHNAVDLPTDCPGRERGAYFGDTYFTARGMEVLLGDQRLERSLFENYALAPSFAGVPKGMIPMCYPADAVIAEPHWIPNFAMWSVIQLEEYVRRSGDRQTAERFRHLADGMLAWFDLHRNAGGLLENLPGWVFLGWGGNESKVSFSVSYATNMLYARFLDAFAEVYARPELKSEAERVRCAIREAAWDGEWFRDFAVREPDGKLTVVDSRSEGCQYFAFFAGVATRETHAELWRRLRTSFGPKHGNAAFPEIAPTDLLFGYCLRFELLSQAGLSSEVLDEVKACFLPMAEKTGTLWEAMRSPSVGFSCDHGFTASAAGLIARHALGIRRIDRAAKVVRFEVPTGIALDWCEGTIPVSETETANFKWRRKGAETSVEVELPSGWRVEK